MRDKIIIFGAGKWGGMAYLYYRTQCEVLCFVDNCKELWGNSLEGIGIYGPEKLRKVDLAEVKIVIANKRRKKQIQEQLYSDYGIRRSIIFEIKDNVEDFQILYDKEKLSDEIIIEYEGGLGNQMFQYAFAKCFMVRGKFVTGDTSTYYNIGRRKFALDKVFPRINIIQCSVIQKRNYIDYCENIEEVSIHTVDEYEADAKLLTKERGFFQGYWQSSKYAEQVRKELKSDFVFCKKCDIGLEKIRKQISSQNAVSVHIRRGDYLTQKSLHVFGGICTIEYYKKAIEKMRQQVSDLIFYFFSDDIEWTRQNLEYANSIYVEPQMFDDYEDWYDMYLMSLCKHNIIANSTFSWWGAWLNDNENKIVIAPYKWMNICAIRDIYPTGWTKLNEI